MQIYFAPLEGVTNCTFRSVYESCFPNTVEKYFAPFITASSVKKMEPKYVKELDGKNNPKVTLIPQILTKNPEDFIVTAGIMKEMGFEEINLNLGCPSRTVVAKKKGSGLLGDEALLKKLLDEIYSFAEKEKLKISIKTRIGLNEEAEWDAILRLYQGYPISELIIHPRLQKEFYRETPHWKAFDQAVALNQFDLCYNGDIISKETLSEFEKNYPMIQKVMIGRGFISAPGFLQNGQSWENTFRFHDELLLAYLEVISGDTHLLFKMKELWCYFREYLPKDNAQAEKLLKKLNKCKQLSEYRDVVMQLKAILL